MSLIEFTPEDMDKQILRVRKGQIATAMVTAEFTTPYAGGLPGDRKNVEKFVEHQLGLTGDEAANAVDRILGEEIKLDNEEAGDEVKHRISYGLNVIRSTSDGKPWVGTWQIRAMIKQSASRLGLFVSKKHSKGDLAESMLILPILHSDCSEDLRKQQHVVICDKDGNPVLTHSYDKFFGSVSSAQGRKSIVHDTQVINPGARIWFAVQWPISRITVNDMVAILGEAQKIGLGSCKSFEHGRFKIISLSVDKPNGKKSESQEPVVQSGRALPSSV